MVRLVPPRLARLVTLALQARAPPESLGHAAVGLGAPLGYRSSELAGGSDDYLRSIFYILPDSTPPPTTTTTTTETAAAPTTTAETATVEPLIMPEVEPAELEDPEASSIDAGESESAGGAEGVATETAAAIKAEPTAKARKRSAPNDGLGVWGGVDVGGAASETPLVFRSAGEQAGYELLKAQLRDSRPHSSDEELSELAAARWRQATDALRAVYVRAAKLKAGSGLRRRLRRLLKGVVGLANRRRT